MAIELSYGPQISKKEICQLIARVALLAHSKATPRLRHQTLPVQYRTDAHCRYSSTGKEAKGGNQERKTPEKKHDFGEEKRNGLL